MSERIAVLGAAFDPPHLGHADVVSQLAAQFSCLWLVPAAAHAFGKIMTAFEHRWNMLLAWQSVLPQAVRERMVLSDIERTMSAAAPNLPVYSYDVLHQIAHKTSAIPVLVLGPDNVQPEVWRKFYRYQDIEREFGICAVEQRLDVRSTDIRQAVTASQDDASLLAWLLPRVGEGVASYIITSRLYRS